MNNYKLQISKSCQDFINELKKYNISLYTQLSESIKEIEYNPFDSKFKKLQNSNGCIRARSGDYRILYFLKKDIIFIAKIGLRKSVYLKGTGCPKFSKKKIKKLIK